MCPMHQKFRQIGQFYSVQCDVLRYCYLHFESITILDHRIYRFDWTNWTLIAVHHRQNLSNQNLMNISALSRINLDMAGFICVEMRHTIYGLDKSKF